MRIPLFIFLSFFHNPLFTLDLSPMLKQTLVGLFSDRREAEEAIDALKSRGVFANDISVLVQDTVVTKEERRTLSGNVARGAGSGTATGASLGGLLGLLVGVGALAIPGIGGIFIAGPLAAALGLTGAAATTVSGALTGALAGGLVGALVGLGFSKEDAELYEQRLRFGDILVAVSLRDELHDEDMVRDVFTRHNAEEVRVLREVVHV